MRKFKFSLTTAAFVLGIGLATVTGFSSFTKAPAKSGSVTYRYYNTAGTVGDTNPADFIYDDNTTDDCVGLSDECSAQWTTTNAPIHGQTPTQAGAPSRVAASGLPGDYNPE